MNEQLIKEFEGKLTMFENSLNSIASNFISKLDALSTEAKAVVENTSFLKKLKVIYDEQNKSLAKMNETIDELMTRLESISEGPTKKKKKK